MKCKYCGAEIPNDSQFCPNCGKNLSQVRRCVKCGEIIDNDAMFCTHCGAQQPVNNAYNSQPTYNGYNQKPKSNNTLLWIIIGVLALILIGGGIFFIAKSHKSAPKPTTTAVADSSASSANKPQEQSTTASADQSYSNVYDGQIGRYPIRMCLSFYKDGSNQTIYGTYYYLSNSNKTKIELSGQKDSSGSVTFSEENGDFDLYDEGSSMTGTWSGGGKTYNVDLRLVRKLSESTEDY